MMSEKEKSYIYDTVSEKRCMALKFLTVKAKFEFCCLQTVGQTWLWAKRSAGERGRGSSEHSHRSTCIHSLYMVAIAVAMQSLGYCSFGTEQKSRRDLAILSCSLLLTMAGPHFTCT